jgi:membrane protein implicated in regulation of membrane protease activity
MSDFSSWWDGLSLILKIYWGLAIPFTLFFILQLNLTFVAGDVADDTPDAEVDADSGIAFQFFTLKNMVAFFTIFSWTGIACIDSGLSVGVSLLISTLAGLAMMALMATMMYFIMKTNVSGTLKMKNALGQVGEVYLGLQAKRGNIGKVQIKVQGSLRTLDALTDDDEDIPTGKVITVSNIINDNILLVTSK